MALFREYENSRIGLAALFYTTSRQEVKIVEFYYSKAAKLPPAMNVAFRLKSLSPEEFEKDWVCTLRRIPSESAPSLSREERRLSLTFSPVSDQYVVMKKPY